MGKLTKEDRLKLIGLATLAAHHRAALKDIERAVESIVGAPEDDIGGWVSDFVWAGDMRPEQLWNGTSEHREQSDD